MSRRQILVADDNLVNRRLVQTALTRSGYDVRETKDGKATLTSCLQEKPDLAIVDIHMPEMDGLTVIRELRKTYSADILPILVLTADVEMSSQECAQSGATDVIYKPLDLEELRTKVRELLDNPFAAIPA